jgi:virulence factor
MRVAVMGLGGIATKAYLPLLSSWPDLELMLFSRTRETVAKFRAQYRLSLGTTDAAELRSWKPQAAFVLTPSDTHFELCAALLQEGVDVFVEKPATLKSGETRELGRLAHEGQRVFMVGFNRRYAPLHAQARELWAGRRVNLAMFTKHRESAAHPDLFSNYIDDTIHVVDLLRFYCGEGRAVRTVSEVREGKLVGATSVVALEGGGQAVVATSLEAGCWSERYALHGTGATLEVEAFSRLRLFANGEERIAADSAGSWRSSLEARGFPQQIAHFLECVASRREPRTSAEESYRTQKLLEELTGADGQS